jgi:hypothetical protein
MSGRFTRPVLPGDSLTVSIWVTDAGSADNGGRKGRALFRTANQDGTGVIDRGVTHFRPARQSEVTLGPEVFNPAPPAEPFVVRWPTKAQQVEDRPPASARAGARGREREAQ